MKPSKRTPGKPGKPGKLSTKERLKNIIVESLYIFMETFHKILFSLDETLTKPIYIYNYNHPLQGNFDGAGQGDRIQAYPGYGFSMFELLKVGWIHVDPGSKIFSRILSGEATDFCAELGPVGPRKES